MISAISWISQRQPLLESLPMRCSKFSPSLRRLSRGGGLASGGPAGYFEAKRIDDTLIFREIEAADFGKGYLEAISAANDPLLPPRLDTPLKSQKASLWFVTLLCVRLDPPPLAASEPADDRGGRGRGVVRQPPCRGQSVQGNSGQRREHKIVIPLIR